MIPQESDKVTSLWQRGKKPSLDPGRDSPGLETLDCGYHGSPRGSLGGGGEVKCSHACSQGTGSALGLSWSPDHPPAMALVLP